MKNSKPLIQRTFIQERFEILIKKQEAGTASFNELTELDEIVNRYPAILEKILEDMQQIDSPPNEPMQEEIIYLQKQENSLWAIIKSVFNRFYMSVGRQVNYKRGGFAKSAVVSLL